MLCARRPVPCLSGPRCRRPCTLCEYLPGVDGGEEMHDARDDARPARLVVRPDSGAVVAVEVLVELQVVAPVRVRLELLSAAVECAAAVAIAQEDRTEPPGQV